MTVLALGAQGSLLGLLGHQSDVGFLLHVWGHLQRSLVSRQDEPTASLLAPYRERLFLAHRQATDEGVKALFGQLCELARSNGDGRVILAELQESMAALCGVLKELDGESPQPDSGDGWEHWIGWRRLSASIDERWLEANRQRFTQQGLIVGSATLSYVALTPVALFWLTGLTKIPTPFQFGVTAMTMVLLSFVAVYGLIPAGGSLQSSEVPLKRFLGKLATVGLETLTTVGLMEGMAWIYDWDPTKALVTGTILGSTQGFPLSEISRKWGRRPMMATIMRQVATSAMQTNTAVITSLASSGARDLGISDFGEIASFNFMIALLFFFLPASREGRVPFRDRDPRVEWSAMSPVEQCLVMLDDSRTWTPREGHTLLKLTLPEGVTPRQLCDYLSHERAFRSWGHYSLGQLLRLLRREGKEKLIKRLSRHNDLVIYGFSWLENGGRFGTSAVDLEQVFMLLREACERVASGLHELHIHVLHSQGRWPGQHLSFFNMAREVSITLAPTYEEARGNFVVDDY